MTRYSPAAIQVRVRLDEVGGRLLLSWRGSAFDALRERWREGWPRHGDATYNAGERAWSLPLGSRPRLERWLTQTCEPACVTWDQDGEQPAGSSTYSDSRTGAGAYNHQSSSVARALRVLCLTPEAPPELVDHVFRWWAKQVHPDAGGDHDRAVALNAAIEVIRKEHAR